MSYIEKEQEMRRIWVVLAVVMALLVVSSCASEAPLSPEDGVWSHECDVLSVSRHTWEAELTLPTGVRLQVKAEFDDFNYAMQESILAFRITPVGERFHSLYIRPDGTYVPELTFFEELSQMVADYPGGYQGFENDLENTGTDWVWLHEQLWLEWEQMYFPDGCRTL